MPKSREGDSRLASKIGLLCILLFGALFIWFSIGKPSFAILYVLSLSPVLYLIYNAAAPKDK